MMREGFKIQSLVWMPLQLCGAAANLSSEASVRLAVKGMYGETVALEVREKHQRESEREENWSQEKREAHAEKHADCAAPLLRGFL
jgi:hypothetical protein